MQLYNTCRFCKKMGFETPKQMMVRYGPRHWCHPECGINKFGAVPFINKLTPYQIGQLPYMVIKDHPEAYALAQRIAIERGITLPTKG